MAVVAHKRVQHHLAAGLEPVPAGDVLVEDAGGVGAENHRRLGFRQPHALQAPQVVMVDGRRLHGHRGPVQARLRLRHVADVQHGQRIIIVDSCGDYGLHRHSLQRRTVPPAIVRERRDRQAAANDRRTRPQPAAWMDGGRCESRPGIGPCGHGARPCGTTRQTPPDTENSGTFPGAAHPFPQRRLQFRRYSSEEGACA